jgi:hypothetical protein
LRVGDIMSLVCMSCPVALQNEFPISSSKSVNQGERSAIPLSLLIPFPCLMNKQIFLSRKGDGKTTHLFRARRRRRRHVIPSPHRIAIAQKRKIKTRVANPQQKDNTRNTTQAFISCRSQSNIPECGSKGICISRPCASTIKP